MAMMADEEMGGVEDVETHDDILAGKIQDMCTFVNETLDESIISAQSLLAQLILVKSSTQIYEQLHATTHIHGQVQVDQQRSNLNALKESAKTLHEVEITLDTMEARIAHLPVNQLILGRYGSAEVVHENYCLGG